MNIMKHLVRTLPIVLQEAKHMDDAVDVPNPIGESIRYE